MANGASPRPAKSRSWLSGLMTAALALLALLELAETAAGSSAACTGASSIAGAWSHGAEQYDVTALDPAARTFEAGLQNLGTENEL